MSKNSQATPFLFVPGNEQEFINPKGNYQYLMDGLLRQGYDPIYIQPDWANGTPQSWVDDALSRSIDIAAPEGRIALGGFSFGAIITLCIAAELEARGPEVNQPVGVLAASTAPYFRRTLPQLLRTFPQEAGNLNPEVIMQLAMLPFPRVRCAVDVCVGEDEIYPMYYQASFMVKNLPQTSLTVVPATGHNILAPNYLQAVARIAGNMAMRA